MKIAKFEIKRVKKSGIQYYAILAPAYVMADKKKRWLYYRTKHEAEKKRTELIAATRTESRELVLSNTQLTDARRAYERLAEAGLTISLDKAIETALPLLLSTGSNITVAELLHDFMEIKKTSWRVKTSANFRQCAGMMIEQFGQLKLTQLTPAALGSWLNSYRKPAYIAGMIRTLRPAFSFAVRRDMLPESPFKKLEPMRVPARAEIDIFTPEEAERLMQVAPDDCKAAFAFLLFAGIRPVELTRLSWKQVKRGFIFLSPEIAKTAQVRNVEIEPNLQAWIDASGYHAPDDMICPTNWKRKAQKARRAADLSGRQDTARHSYASYHLVKYRDKGLLEANMGHVAGAAVLMKHYRAATTPEQAARYWSILPSFS